MKAAESGNIQAQYNLGVMFMEKNQNIEAEKYFLNASLEGDSDAQNNLGIVYKRIGNFKEAEKWLLKSSKQGNIKAQYNLGELYEEKLNNKEKAIYWYEKSFSLGDNDSEKKLIELRGK